MKQPTNTQPFKKTYCEIKRSNWDIYIILTYASGCNVHFTYFFNSISGGYMGLEITSFVDSVRGLINACPNFFNEVSEHSYEKDFERLGFEKIEPTEKELTIFNN